jgi:hypothetical protein
MCLYVCQSVGAKVRSVSTSILQLNKRGHYLLEVAGPRLDLATEPTLSHQDGDLRWACAPLPRLPRYSIDVVVPKLGPATRVRTSHRVERQHFLGVHAHITFHLFVWFLSKQDLRNRALTHPRDSAASLTIRLVPSFLLSR